MIPIFTSNFSIGDTRCGSSILTLDESVEAEDPNAPASILQIAKNHGLKKIFLLEKRFSGFRQAYKTAESEGVQLVFGIRFHVCDKIADKTEESWGRVSKVNIFAKNAAGVKELMGLYSKAFTEGFYDSRGRIDWDMIKNISGDLSLTIPFYDSFIFENMLNSKSCMPAFPNHAKPIFFIENNGLPFDGIMKKAVEKYCGQYGYQTKMVKTILYYMKKDFVAYQTFRCFERRANLQEPNMEHMSSDRFSFESWLEENSCKKN